MGKGKLSVKPISIPSPDQCGKISINYNDFFRKENNIIL